MTKHLLHPFFNLAATLLIALSVTGAAPSGAQAQNLFAPVILVNDKVITRYEINQRVLLLKMLGAKGAIVDLAQQQLIEERLKIGASEALGLVVSEEGIQAGIEEFAGQANLEAEQMFAALRKGGVDPESFRDFVRAGISWRELVKAKYGARVQITDRDIDRAYAQSGTSGPVYAAIEYAAYYIPGGRSAAALAQAAKIKGRIDTCDDLYAVAHGQPAEVLERGTKAPSDIPADIARELTGLDKNEVSTALTRANGNTLVFLMLCGRTTALSDEVPREAVSLQLQNQRLVSYANGFLAQLRADARIIRK